tara:strand:- start:940 stop:1101 length:162 start_codon:yes stop_codon:yes gene_type:complete
MELDKEDEKEFKELIKEIKNMSENNVELDFNLLSQLEYDLNKLKEKIKNESKN